MDNIVYAADLFCGSGGTSSGLVMPVIEKDGKLYRLDILFRMLQPHELAQAMSFPKSYKFKGTREQVVKQIGNSVPVRLAESLCKSLLNDGKRTRKQ